MVTHQVPAGNRVEADVAPPGHRNVYVPLPPVAEAVTVAESPAHVGAVVTNALGTIEQAQVSKMTTELESVHPLASVTVTLYVLADSPVIFCVVAELLHPKVGVP